MVPNFAPRQGPATSLTVISMAAIKLIKFTFIYTHIQTITYLKRPDVIHENIKKNASKKIGRRSQPVWKVERVVSLSSQKQKNQKLENNCWP